MNISIKYDTVKCKNIIILVNSTYSSHYDIIFCQKASKLNGECFKSTLRAWKDYFIKLIHKYNLNYLINL